MEKIKDALINGQAEEAKKLAQQALDEGHDAQEILDNGVLAGMNVVGERFGKMQMYIPEVLMCAQVMHSVMEIVKPKLAGGEGSSEGTVLIGTVEGDLHDIGKNLVGMMLEGAGFKVIDIGIDQPPQAFVDAVKKEKPQVVGMSALLTTTAPNIEKTINALKEAGVRDDVKIIIGGAVIDQQFADDVGADAYGPSATSSVGVVKKLVG